MIVKLLIDQAKSEEVFLVVYVVKDFPYDVVRYGRQWALSVLKGNGLGLRVF